MSDDQNKAVVKLDAPEKAIVRSDAASLLLSLPEHVQGEIAAFVKQQIDISLQPAPVTWKIYFAHILVSILSLFLLWADLTARAFTKVDKTSQAEVLVLTLAFFILLWLLSFLFSLVMKIQVRAFRLSAILLSFVLAFISLTVTDFLSAYIEFGFQSETAVNLVYGALIISVVTAWAQWYLRAILSTTKARIAQTICFSVAALLLLGVYAYNQVKSDVREVKFKMPVVAFAANSGSSQDFNVIIAKLLDEAAEKAAKTKLEGDEKKKANSRK